MLLCFSRNVDARLELLLNLLMLWRNARYSNGQNHRLFPNYPVPENVPTLADIYPNVPQNQGPNTSGKLVSSGSQILGPYPHNPSFGQYPHNHGISGPFPNNKIAGPFPHNPNIGVSGPYPNNGGISGHFPNNHNTGISGPFPQNQHNQILGPFPNDEKSSSDHHIPNHGHTDSHTEEDDEHDTIGVDPEHGPDEVFEDSFQKNVIKTDREPIVPIEGHDH